MSRGWPRTLRLRALMGSVIGMSVYQYLPLVSGLETVQDVLEAVGSPEEFFLLDDEGWGEADDVVVRLFCEDAFAHEGFADGAGSGGQLDGDPEASSADFDDMRTVDLLEAVEEEGA